MTPAQVSALSDTELNRAMTKIAILSHYSSCKVELDESQNCFWVETSGFSAWPIGDYLSDWNLTMPLAVMNKLLIQPMNSSMWPSYWAVQNNKAIGVKRYNKNPLRAICEVLVLIALEKAQN